MYQYAVSFTVPADRREDFIAEALRDARGSLADEPGCLRFDVLADSDDPLVFHLNEAYADQAAAELHKAGENFQRFFEAISEYADGPTRCFTGTTVEDPAGGSPRVRQPPLEVQKGGGPADHRR